MNVEFYRVSTFCNDMFLGNPAAVCPLDQWPADKYLRHIASESYLTKTAFLVKEADHYYVRWFTPVSEVDLCGHSTLAAAHVVYDHKGQTDAAIVFNSRAGSLGIKKTGDLITVDLPADELHHIDITPQMSNWFSAMPVEAFRGKRDYLLVFPSDGDIMQLKPNLPVIAALNNTRGVIVTAKGGKMDFVSRFFAPQSGIPEDPVSGSAHITLTAYWSARLRKKELKAVQLSGRKGYVECLDLGKRVALSGRARTFLVGQIYV